MSIGVETTSGLYHSASCFDYAQQPCGTHDVTLWIPAFAGMTAQYSLGLAPLSFRTVQKECGKSEKEILQSLCDLRMTKQALERIPCHSELVPERSQGDTKNPYTCLSFGLTRISRTKNCHVERSRDNIRTLSFCIVLRLCSAAMRNP